VTLKCTKFVFVRGFASNRLGTGLKTRSKIVTGKRGRAYNGVWGGAPSRVQGQVRGSGAKPPEAESFYLSGSPYEGKICNLLCILQMV